MNVEKTDNTFAILLPRAVEKVCSINDCVNGNESLLRLIRDDNEDWEEKLWKRFNKLTT